MGWRIPRFFGTISSPSIFEAVRCTFDRTDDETINEVKEGCELMVFFLVFSERNQGTGSCRENPYGL